MLYLWIEWSEEQQVLILERHAAPAAIHTAQAEFERIVPLAHLHLRNVRAQHRRDLASFRIRYDLAHRAPAGQKRIEVTVQKGVDAPLPSAHRHLAQKALQALLRPLVAACHAHAARQPDQLADGRVHHRHRLAHLAVKRCLPVQQRHIALKPSECTASAAAQLHGGLAARASLLLPGYFHPVLSFSVLFIAPRAPPRASQCRLRVPFSRSTR